MSCVCVFFWGKWKRQETDSVSLIWVGIPHYPEYTYNRHQMIGCLSEFKINHYSPLYTEWLFVLILTQRMIFIRCMCVLCAFQLLESLQTRGSSQPVTLPAASSRRLMRGQLPNFWCDAFAAVLTSGHSVFKDKIMMILMNSIRLGTVRTIAALFCFVDVHKPCQHKQ